MSAVAFEQWLIHENVIVSYIWNYKYYDVNQGHFRKPLWGFAKVEISAGNLDSKNPELCFSPLKNIM